MATSLTTDDGYYSALAVDPDYAGLVRLFVEEMPQRLRALQLRCACADWDALARLAHQLKGAAGSYGFDQITPFAARLESAIRNSMPSESIIAALDELSDACGRVRAGTRSTNSWWT